MVPFLPLSSFQWGFSEGAPKLAMSIQQGRGRQRSYGKTKCEDPITYWNTLPWHFTVKCNFQAVFPTMHLSVYVSSHLSANPPRRTRGHYWGSEKLSGLFSLEAVPLPPWISCIPPGGGFLPPPSLGWSLWAVAALSLTPCAAAAAALLCCTKCCLLTLPPLGDH